ncbi:heme ABC transporter ATP-binding protein [Spirochaetia bacterium]|nr:heme ABC transporter ATP-binding protein [Spirochaetia bacterium]
MTEAPEPAGAEYPVELRGITKVYPGNPRRVNNRVNLSLRRGEILCLAGENGAGKTTLMKILYGIEAPTEGEIFVRGKIAKIVSPLAANRLGIGMVFQHFMLFPELTVAQNVVMGLEPVRFGIFYDKAKAEAAVNAVIEANHFSIEADKPVHSLTVGQMQQVEILKLLYRNVEIVILDEPTAVLIEQEILSLFKTLKALADAGKSIVLITHKLQEIKLISDRVAVMRRGELVGIRDTGEIDEYGISRMMIGSGSAEPGAGSAENFRSRVEKAEGAPALRMAEPVLSFDRVTVKRRGQKRLLLDNISFTVRAGEILGFAGVGGNGLGVLEAVLGGFLPITSGNIYHREQDISRFDAPHLRREGLAYVPADRLRVGSDPAATVNENIILNRRGEFSPHGFLDTRAIRSFSADLIRRYDIAGEGGQNAATLSGGNIQKMILAREIDQFRDYIVFSEPTWGLDIAASAYVYGEIGKLRDRGAAVILISTNLDEILSIADRIIVFYRGTIAVELDNSDTTQDIKKEIGAYMMGLKRIPEPVPEMSPAGGPIK